MPAVMSQAPHGEQPEDVPEDVYVASRTLSLLYARTPAILAANFINGLLTAAIFQDVVSPLLLGLWVGLTLSLIVVRLVFWLLMRDRSKQGWLNSFRRVSQFGSCASGALWGAAGFLFFVPASPFHLAALVFVLGGMAAGSLTTLYAHPLAFNGYLLLSMMPFCARLAVEGGRDHWLMAGMVLLFVFSLLMIGRRTHSDLLQRFKLQYENRELIRGLEQRVEDRTHRHATVVEFSHRALSGSDTDTLLRESVSIVASGLPASFVLVSEWLPRERILSVRAAGGRKYPLLGQAVQPGGDLSPAGYALSQGEPIVSTDLRREDRFASPALLQQLGVVSTISVPIWGQGSPFGVLEAWSTQDKPFAADDVSFVRAVSTTIAAALDRRRAEDGLQQLALHDALTGLPNRALFHAHLSSALDTASRNGDVLAVLLADLDEFKDVNDTLGHAVGDQLLAQVAGRLRECTRKSDPPARLGGDEFAVVLSGLSSPDGAASVAEKIVKRLSEPFHLSGEPVHVGASVGITIYPTDGGDTNHLLRNADLALYKAKAGGRRAYAFYSPEMALDVEKRIDLLRDLRRAIAGSELDLEYQPQIDLTTGDIKGAEALLRWDNPRLGRILPETFVPLAESSDLIASLGDWTMRTACAQAREWFQSGLPRVTIAVNVSLSQWRRMSTSETIDRVMQACDSDPEFLELEITERAFPVTDHERLLECLGLLRREGVSISIDDFGTGYSNLARLHQLPVDKIKIDQSFIKGLGQDRNAETIVRAIITLSHNLGLKVIAEGVEQHDQLDFLRSEGCDLAQGYVLGRPVPADRFSHVFDETPEDMGRTQELSVN